MTVLGIELHEDGGIRLTTLEGATGLATLDATRDWIASANARNTPVRLGGALSAPNAAPVADEVRRLADSLDEQPSEPGAWAHGDGSLATAARSGLAKPIADLLARVPGIGERDGGDAYKLAMRHGHVDALRALRDGGAKVPRGLTPPDSMPDAVVFRAELAPAMWWLVGLCCAALLVIGAVGIAAGAYPVAILMLAATLAILAAMRFILRSSRCAIDGPHIARDRGLRWDGPVDLRQLDALGYAPQGSVRMPAVWFLGHRTGHRLNSIARRAFTDDQLARLKEIDGFRCLPLVATRAFMSPGIERYLATWIDRDRVIVGHHAERRVWDAGQPGSSTAQ